MNKDELFGFEKIEFDYEKMSKEELINIIKVQDSMLEAHDEIINKKDRVILKQTKAREKYVKIILELLDKQKVKNKIIDDIDIMCRLELAFKNRLIRDKEDIDDYNQGRFYICELIMKILEKGEL